MYPKSRTSDCSDAPPASAQHLLAGLGCANSQLHRVQLMPAPPAAHLSPAWCLPPAVLGSADQQASVRHAAPNLPLTLGLAVLCWQFSQRQGMPRLGRPEMRRQCLTAPAA
eukprot:Tamp_15665.p6 GENE.Tamp_15665~~Tamp_15665.p6  ORF type:complete len:111 (+),score=14.38 Tamp_15665:823-1155(+)